jgi:hypothetical protein
LNSQIKAKSDRITKLRGNERPITLDVEEWLELMKKLHALWKKAKLEPKKIIAQKVFLELIIKNGKLADYTCKDTYKALEKANLDDDGGASWLFTELPTIYRAIRDIRIPWAVEA